MPTTYFISDLHLCPDSGPVNRRFSDFLSGPALSAQRLVINGDLVEYWFGRKQRLEPFYRDLMDRLGGLVQRGVEVAFVAGNRDFLLVPDAGLWGVKGYLDGCRFDLEGEAVYITHGDQFCLRDISYLRFRRVMRLLPLHALGRLMPAFVGRWVAARLRRNSQARRLRNPSRGTHYFDIENEAVMPHFNLQRATTIICGHIHQPQERVFTAEGGTTRRLLVLGDWGPDSAVIARKVDASPVELCLLDGEGINPWPHVVKSAMPRLASTSANP